MSPFAVGDVDPSGPFVHVLDDATLDIVLGELDTITDLTSYLSKKEKLIRSGQLTVAAGEEELVAYYMTHMNSSGEHDFTKPDGTSLGENDHIGFDGGFYDELRRNMQYRAKKAADVVSYGWDKLIEQFTTNMLAGTTIVPEGMRFELSELEQGIRHMALVHRYKRRLFGEAIQDAFEKSVTTDRFTRVLLPGLSDRERETAFFFMTLAIPKFEVKGGYEGYRAARRKMLEIYAYAVLEKHRDLRRVVGVATELRNHIDQGGSSEDLIVVETPGTWTNEFLVELEELKKTLNILQDVKPYRMQSANEFPRVTMPSLWELDAPKPNRKQRRAAAARARKHGK